MRAVGIWMEVGALVIVAYAYFLYPAALTLLAAGRRSASRGAGASEPSPASWPQITITVPVYNERQVIRGTLDSLLATDYPPERRHILVISDASTDGTDDIVKEYAGRGVTLLRLLRRAGKTAAENASAAHIRGDIVVNTDASVRIPPEALKPLVAALRDPAVGVASGRDVSVADTRAPVNPGESGYVGYEMWVRDLETRAGGIVGASGCFFATRRMLHEEMVPEALSRDFAAPLIARERGFRSVSVPAAVCYVPRAASLGREYRRKVRTMTRGLETLAYKRHLLNPLRYGGFAWMLLSHKLVRWLVPWAAVAGVVAAGMLALEPGYWWARGALSLAGVVGLLAVTGWLWPLEDRLPRLLSVPAYLASGIVAGLWAWLKAAQGELTPVWEPTRRG